MPRPTLRVGSLALQVFVLSQSGHGERNGAELGVAAGFQRAQSHCEQAVSGSSEAEASLHALQTCVAALQAYAHEVREHSGNLHGSSDFYAQDMVATNRLLKHLQDVQRQKGFQAFNGEQRVQISSLLLDLGSIQEQLAQPKAQATPSTASRVSESDSHDVKSLVLQPRGEFVSASQSSKGGGSVLAQSSASAVDCGGGPCDISNDGNDDNAGYEMMSKPITRQVGPSDMRTTDAGGAFEMQETTEPDSDGVKIMGGDRVKVMSAGSEPDTQETGSHSVHSVRNSLQTHTFSEGNEKPSKDTYTLTLDNTEAVGGMNSHSTYNQETELTPIESSEESTENVVIDHMRSTADKVSHASTELAHLQEKEEDSVEALQAAYEQKKKAVELARARFEKETVTYRETKAKYNNQSESTASALEIYRSIVEKQHEYEKHYVEAWKTFHRLQAEALRAKKEESLALAHMNGQADKIKYWQALLDKESKDMADDELELAAVRNMTKAKEAPAKSNTRANEKKRSKNGTPRFAKAARCGAIFAVLVCLLTGAW